MMHPTHGFPAERKAGVYDAIFRRRDIRSHFLPAPVPVEVLARILRAAHHAPSVGFMQPWDFHLIRSHATRLRVKEAFLRTNEEAALRFEETRRGTYREFKLEGILEAPLNICVTCDRTRFGPVVIGRTHQPEMDLYSSVCAVQNLWLAARSEGLGVGWVSILDRDELKAILGIAPRVSLIAYLCVGYVSEFPERPELETAEWIPRLPLARVVRTDDAWPELQEALRA